MVNRSLSLDHEVRAISAQNLNQILADTMTLRDTYKQHHWQVSGPAFYQLHLPFDKHFNEQAAMSTRLPNGFKPWAELPSQGLTMPP